MKKLFIILCILFFATPCLANQIIIGKKKAAPSCSTESQTCTTETSGDHSGVGATYTKKAWKFQASETTTICKIEIYAKEVGAMTNTVVVSIRNDDSGKPGTLVGDASSATDPSGWGTSYGYRAFTVSAAITATNEYWVQVETSGADESNYMQMRSSNACDYEEGIKYWDGGACINSNQYAGIMYKMYK
jgi:hypothetical protein